MKPPFEITPEVLSLCLDIQELLGELKSVEFIKPSINLRKANKIRTIHHSLAIEGNTLTEEQITALLEMKKVIGPKKQIQEVLNALKLYDRISDLNPFVEKDLLRAHSILMKDLVSEAGAYRSRNVGIIKGTKVGHVAPQAKMVSSLMRDLFSFLKAKDKISLLLKACVFHYELEFIHPFEDGNGRMGRFWQQLILTKHSPVFEYLALETLIHKEQEKYYKALEACDRDGNSNAFIEFSLRLIKTSLTEFKDHYRPGRQSSEDRLAIARDRFGQNPFSRKEYLDIHKGISTATASRDLAEGVSSGALKKIGDKALTKYVSKKIS